MVQETVSELLSRHGMFLGDLDDQGMPQLDGEDEFHSTYQQISLVVGHDHDLGIGTLHTSVRYAAVEIVVAGALCMTFPVLVPITAVLTRIGRN